MSLRNSFNDYYFGYANLLDEKERRKIYYQSNRDNILLYLKIWRKHNPDYMKKWLKYHPDYMKNYYQNNRYKILERIRLPKEDIKG